MIPAPHFRGFPNSSPEKYKILIIDDEKSARMVLEDFLDDSGFEVLTAENGREGLVLVQQENPDVVLTDIRMPVMDGLEVIEAMQDNTPFTPVIIVSGEGVMDNVISALRLGAWDYILKPIRDLEVLRQTIQRSLERSSQLQFEKNYQENLEEEVREKTARLKAEVFAKEIAQGQVEHEAYHDSLTQMGNRLLCMKELEKIHLHGRPDHHIGLLYFDIRSLKNINDAYGYSFGDTLLIYIADRLYGSIPQNTKFYRMGGDEFAVFLEGEEEEIIYLANSICDSIKQPYQIGNEAINVNFAFGLTLGSNPAVMAEKLINEATFAHLQAKRTTIDSVVVYDDDLHKKHLRRLCLEKDMPRSLAAGEFSMAFQPIVNIKARMLYGFEGLLRWNNNREGIVSPEEFIAISEENEFILELGEWALDHACRFWQKSGLHEKGLTLSINISSKQFRLQGLVSKFHHIIEEAHIPFEKLCLEITESALMTQVEETARKLGDFRKHKIKIAIDDFGTGYSSLKYLSDFPVDSIKIDMSYVQKMENNPKIYELIKIMAKIASVFGLDLIGEGVETQVQRDLLNRIGCYLQQGYLYSKPIPEDHVLDFCNKFSQLF
jgi:diguanylate cyclase (GGDEF)-like protein